MTSISEEFYLLSTFQKSGDISGLTKYAKFPEPRCCCKRDTMRRACVRILHSIVCAARITFFHAAAPSTSRLRKRVGGMPDRQTKALNLRFARRGPMRDPELLAFAGACPAAVCRLVFNSVRISESAAPATLSLDRSRHRVQVLRRSEYPF
jgi:hypothetical protein